MPHPVIHAEIRSQDPDATRAFFAELFGWTYSDGAFPGYTFVEHGIDGAIPTAIGRPPSGWRRRRPVLRRRLGRRGDARSRRSARWEDDPAGSAGPGRDVRRIRRPPGPY